VSAVAVLLVLGAGELTNNINTRTPGYMGSAKVAAYAGHWGLDAGYTRVGKSELAMDAAFTTAGVSYRTGRWTLGVDSLVRASYSPEVWWDSRRPAYTCQMAEPGCKRYPNDRRHLNKSAAFAGTVSSVQYDWRNGLGLRVEYYGLIGLSPTFQGVAVQMTYTVLP